jgi:hypothetical protein
VTPTRRELLLVLPFFIGMAVLFTWPLATRLTSHVPGTADGVNAMVGLYVLTWGIHALANHPFQFFHANVFYPNAESLAFGDHLFGVAASMAPLQWTLANPTLTYNAAVLLSFAVAGLGAYLLARHMTGSVRAGLLAGILFGFSMFRFHHLGQLSVLALHGLPWIFLIGHMYLETRRGRMIYLGAFFALWQITSSALSLGLLGVSALLAFVFALIRQSRRHKVLFWKHRIHFLAATAGLLLAAHPFMKPYLNHELEHLSSRPSQSAEISPAGSVDVASLDPVSLFDSLFKEKSQDNDSVAPGLVALALIGFLALRLLFGERLDRHRVMFYAILAAAGTLLSVGLHFKFGGLVGMCCAVLAAMGYKSLEAWSARFVPYGAALVSILLPVAAVEHYAGPPRLFESMPREGPPPVYLWLSKTEPEAAVIELPTPPVDSTATFSMARRQFFSVYHWHPVVGGVAKWVPPSTRDFLLRMQEFPDSKSMAQIRALHVDYIVIHLDEYPDEERRALVDRLRKTKGLSPEQTFGSSIVYRVEES